MPQATQTNVRAGDFPFTAGADLRDMEGRLVVIGVANGKPVATLPAATTEDTPAVLIEGAGLGGTANLRPLTGNQSVRLVLKGTCNPGNRICMADPSAPADAGEARAVPAANGTYLVVGIAEEVGVDGQHVRVRPYGPLSVTIAN